MTDPSADASAGDDASGPGNKVARLVDEYGLADTAAELERSWTARGEERRSLRELADLFNERLLEHHLAAADERPLAGEVETLYSLLSGEEVNESDRIRARRRLEQQGIDVGRLVDEFVSYQTVRRYLKNHRGVTHATPETDRLETEAQNLRQLVGRVETVTRDKLESLRAASDLSLGEFRVTVDVRVYCEACESQYAVGDLLDAGGCDCDGRRDR